MTPNQKAFLDMIAYSEIGPALLALTDNGYRCLVGSTPEHPHIFYSYKTHPRKLIRVRDDMWSTAAGRYQLLARYYSHYRQLLELHDFSPDSQDAIALQQIKECRALDDIEAGRFDLAVQLCAHIWASLPGAGYEQHENRLADLKDVYVKAGGTVTA